MNHLVLLKNDTLKASRFHDRSTFCPAWEKYRGHSFYKVGWLHNRVSWISWGSAETSVEPVQVTRGTFPETPWYLDYASHEVGCRIPCRH